MKRYRKWIALAALLCSTPCALIAGPATESAGAGAEVAPAGVLPIVAEPITMSIFMRKHPWGDIEYENNRAIAWFEDRTNIMLDVVLTVGEENVQRDLLLNSGDYPEMLIAANFSNLDIMNFGLSQQVLLPLNELIDEYGFEIKRVFEEIPTFRADVTAPDGNIYGLPGVEQCYHCQGAPKLWLNHAWLEKLGLDTPTTTEEFYQVLKAFKEGDPNGNGEADEIPLTGCINTWLAEPERFLMNAFIYNDSAHYLLIEDGVIDTAANKPEYRDGLRYIRRLYREGLIDSAAFTQGIDQLQQIGQNPGTVIMGAFTAGHVAMSIDLEDAERTRMYRATPPLEGPNGVRWGTFSDMSRFEGASAAITDKASNPAAVFRFLDFMFSLEATLTNAFGLEGEDWRPGEPGELDLLGRPAKFTTLGIYSEVGTEANYNRISNSPHYLPFDLYMSWAAPNRDIFDPGSGSYELRLYEATRKYEPFWPDETVPPLFFEPEAAAEMAQLKTNIVSYVNQSTVRFITGDLDLESDWDGYVKGLENLGLARYLELYQTTYDSNAAAQ